MDIRGDDSVKVVVINGDGVSVSATLGEVAGETIQPLMSEKLTVIAKKNKVSFFKISSF
jgi:hypothetical protein